MADVMRKAIKLNDIGVDSLPRPLELLVIEARRNGLPDVRNFNRMRKSVAKEIVFVPWKELGLSLEAPEGGRMQDSAKVAAEIGAVARWFDEDQSILAIGSVTRANNLLPRALTRHALPPCQALWERRRLIERGTIERRRFWFPMRN
jgi:hypothetical protein